MLPASIYIVFHPAQHGTVHFLLRGYVQVVTGDQIQDLGRVGKKSIQISSDFYIRLNFICLYVCSYQRGRESVLTRKRTHRKDYVTTDRMPASYLLFTSLHSWVSSLPSSSLACAFICSTLTAALCLLTIKLNQPI